MARSALAACIIRAASLAAPHRAAAPDRAAPPPTCTDGTAAPTVADRRRADGVCGEQCRSEDAAPAHAR